MKNLKIDWTEEKKSKVLKMIEDWIQEHGVTCGESVQQCDGPSIDSVNIMSDIVDVVEPTDDES